MRKKILKIAAVDDDAQICESVRKMIELHTTVSIAVKCYTNPEQLQFDIQDGITYDVYFLDVKMPVINGIVLAKYIRKYQANANIIFLTSSPQFAIHGFDLEIKASHYVLKDKMEEYIPKILYSLEKEIMDEGEFYIIENQLRFVRIELNRICYVRKEEKI